jgi:signal transduction histidine kinase/ligand-binding sensor domain-containing protein
MIVAAALALLTPVSPALATTPAQPVPDYILTHFTADDGLLANVVDRIEQTPDGFLWLIVNGSGLARFDGRHFDLLLAGGVRAIAVAPGGDLWIGTADDLKRVPCQDLGYFDPARATSYGPTPGSAGGIHCLHFDRAGVLWVGTEAGLFRFQDGRFTPVGPRIGIHEIEDSSNGKLLLITSDGFEELDRSGVVQRDDLAARLGTGRDAVFHVMEDRRGDVWYCTAQGVARRSGARWQRLDAYGPGGHGAFRTYEDEQSRVWVAKADGVFRATSTGLELMVPRMQARAFCSDRDGNLWVGTNGDGLYRFKERRARVFTTADGLPSDVIMTVLAARDGLVWAGANCGGLARFDGTRFRAYDEADGLRNSCVWALAEDANHDLWVGTWGGGAFRLHDGRFTQYLAGEIVISIVAARDSSMWFATRRGLVRLRDSRTRRYTTSDGLKHDSVSRVYEDRTGRILAGSQAGMAVLVGDRFHDFAPAPHGKALPAGEDRAGALYVDLPDQPFVIRTQGSRVDTLPDLSQPTGLVETSGELWFGGSRILRVPRDSFSRTLPHDEPLDNEWFGVQDGLASAEVSGGSPSTALAGDGTLWFATPLGLVTINPRRFPWKPRPVTIYVREVTVGRNTRPARRDLVLSPGTNHVEIDFAAVEVSSPEKVRMQYRLDGVDGQWLDAGTDTRAIYSNIPPGRHPLRVRACGGNGIWDRAGITYLVHQEPHYYQTHWFLALMVAMVLASIFLVHRLRVRQVAMQLGARFDERLAERTRVARDLHDTFLQTVHGSRMIAEHALKRPDDHARLVGAIEQLADWLGRATEEARAALNSLRTSTIERNELAEAFRHAMDEGVPGSAMKRAVTVTGSPRELHPIVRDEVYRIGYEAIRNACAHSDAAALTVRIEHANDLTLTIVDDGGGMDSMLLERGREGHFGLRGMRERAERIGAKLTLASAPGLGTRITLVVPGRLAYGIPGSNPFPPIS